MKKGILHIQLTKGTTTSSNKRNKGTDCVHVSNWGEGLLIITPILLLKTPSSQARLVALNGAIGLSLHLVDLSQVMKLHVMGEE